MTEREEGQLLQQVSTIATDVGDIKRTQDEFQKSHATEHSKIWTQIAVLKSKAGVWGIMGGIATVGTALLVYFITNM